MPASPSEPCCCAALDTTKPTPPLKVAPELVCVGTLAVEVEPRPAVHADSADAREHPSESPPLNVLHCLWLC